MSKQTMKIIGYTSFIVMLLGTVLVVGYAAGFNAGQEQGYQDGVEWTKLYGSK